MRLICSSLLARGGAYLTLLLLNKKQHPSERNSTSRLLLFQIFGINYNARFAPKIVSSPTTRRCSEMERLSRYQCSSGRAFGTDSRHAPHYIMEVESDSRNVVNPHIIG